MKIFTTFRSGSWIVFWWIDVLKMSRNIERLQIRAKSFENTFSKVAGPLQLCWKINYTTRIFQPIGLSFKNNCYSEKTSKKSMRILKSNVYYDTQCALLFIFSFCSWFDDRPFTKQGQIAWMVSTCFQVPSIKKKGKHGEYSVEDHSGKYSI